VTGHRLALVRTTNSDGGNLVVAAARWSAIAKNVGGGADNALGGIATHVFERRSDGRLKLKLHTFN
jgi:ketosteroid isomerase-like protein